MAVNPSQTRPHLVSLVLLCVLLLTVGGAWLLVRFYYSPSREGAAILQDMQKQGLGALWPAKRYVGRFVQKDHAGKAERDYDVVRQGKEKSFVGVERTKARSGEYAQIGNVTVNWEVSNDLAEGLYTANYVTRGFRVSIALAGDQVRFQGSGMKGFVSTDRPANYIPEGLDWLVVRQVARAGKKASFRMIDDLVSLEGKTIVFYHLILTPVNRQLVQGRLEGEGGHEDLTYHLNADGEVERVEYETGSVLSSLPAGKASQPETPSSSETSPEAPSPESPTPDLPAPESPSPEAMPGESAQRI